MKKVLLLLTACVSLILTGCNKDNEGDYNPTSKGKVKYEASVSDPVNYKIAIGYVDGKTTELKQIVVESPFTYEHDAKYGDYLYCSVRAEPKDPMITPAKSVKVTMYTDGNIRKTDSGEIVALVQALFGVADSDK